MKPDENVAKHTDTYAKLFQGQPLTAGGKDRYQMAWISIVLQQEDIADEVHLLRACSVGTR